MKLFENVIVKLNFILLTLLCVSITVLSETNNQAKSFNKDLESKDFVSTVVEKLPQFPGGYEALMNFIGANLHYPVISQENGIQGTVFVRFIVTKLGDVADVEVVRGLDQACDKEAVRVISMLPKWIPAQHKGENVSFNFALPIKFKIIDDRKTTKIAAKPESQTLYIHDGKEVSQAELELIEKDRIKEINVLKAGPATAIYGDNGVMLINQKKETVVSDMDLVSTKDTLENIPYDIVEQMPYFHGGDAAMLNFIGKNIHYPASAVQHEIQGKVIVRFVVDETGKVSKAEVLKSLSPACDKEAIRVVQMLPDFIPGNQGGKNVAVWYTLPVQFRLGDKVTVYKQKEVWSPTEQTIVVYNGKVQPANFNTDNLDMNTISSVAMIEPTNEYYKEKLRLQYGNEAKNGAIVITGKNNPAKKDSISDFINIDDDNYIFVKTDSMAYFKDSNQTANDFIKQHLKYSQTAQNQGIEGEVVIQFVVDKSGKIRDPRFIKKVNPLLDDAAMDVVTAFPDWTPGVKDGTKINSLCTVPFLFSQAKDTTQRSKNEVNDSISVVVEQMPQFPGGDKALLEFIGRNLKFPKDAVDSIKYGEVMVQFVINSEGNVEQTRILRGISDEFDKEALRVVKLLPKWIPGKQNGKNVSVRFNLPIRFRQI